MANDELLVSVDIEASGPTPSTGSMIALGACLVEDESTGFYTLIKPLPDSSWSERAEAVHRLPRELVAAEGAEPAAAMANFADWLAGVAGGRRAVFVGWNAGFDWMFVADYFERFLGRNPFGIAPLDMKAYVMGRQHIDRWADTRRGRLAEHYGPAEPLTHHALDDARQQAVFIRRLLTEPDGPPEAQ
jgi:ribonuclease T